MFLCNIGVDIVFFVVLFIVFRFGLIWVLILLINLDFCLLFLFVICRLCFNFFIWWICLNNRVVKNNNLVVNMVDNIYSVMIIIRFVVILFFFFCKVFWLVLYFCCSVFSLLVVFIVFMEFCYEV